MAKLEEMQEKIREKLARINHKDGRIWAKIYKTEDLHNCKWEELSEYHRELYLAGADYALSYLQSQGGRLQVERDLPLISRERAESAVPKTDCAGRKYTPTEWEDNVRYLIDGAEIQRDKDKFDSGWAAFEPLIEEAKHG